ncbi:MAG: CCA tRNA nucleotidyltransferase [Candidatus Paceibacterota bacterium]
MKDLNSHIPEYVTRVTDTLQDAGFEAYLVGGCVRDLILGREPKDWDITTNAVPKEIIGLFEKTFYENTYGTVGVVVKTEDIDVTHETKEDVAPAFALTHETTTNHVDSRLRENDGHTTDISGETTESTKTEGFSFASQRPASAPRQAARAISQIVTHETEGYVSRETHEKEQKNVTDKTHEGQNVPNGVAICQLADRQATVARETPQYYPGQATDDEGSEFLSGMTEPIVSGETVVVEVTPYRVESEYTDKRHPDEVVFSKKLEDDLKRRDFTINALAYNPREKIIIDLYKGQEDIKDKIIKAIGKPEDRFNEDALRLLRAVRFSSELGFIIEKETGNAVQRLSENLKNISSERIRDEFIKIIMSDGAMNGIILAHDLGLLRFIVPELEKGIGLEQKGMHIYTIWEHNLRALDTAVKHGWPLHIRLAALLHDISKPETRRWSEEKNKWTFYGHDVVGGRVSKKVLERLKFPVKLTNTVSAMVKYHMFFSDIEKITLSAVRRIVANVGAENVWDLMKIRACDRIGMGRPVEKPYRLRKYEAMIEEAMRSPVSVGMLKIDGTRIMEVTHETPGPKLGLILHALLEEVLEDPGLNTEEYLEKRTLELIKLPETELKKLGEEGKEKKAEAEELELTEIRKKHGVK